MLFFKSFIYVYDISPVESVDNV